MTTSRDKAITALERGSEYMNCILQDCRTWLSLVSDMDCPNDDAIAFLLTRIDSELSQQ